jgi:hypothetical protein
MVVVSAPSQVITYQPYRGSNGIDLDGQDVVVYADGREVSRQALTSPAQSIELLLCSYEVPDMFPGLVFCHTEPETHVVIIDYSYTLPKNREIHGWITLEGDRYHWWARWRELIRGSGEVPADRPWLHAEELNKGFEFCLPPALSQLPDPLVVRRIVLALESFIYAIRDGWPIDIPYRYHFDNLFSADASLWRGEPPAVSTAWMSPLLRQVDRL